MRFVVVEIPDNTEAEQFVDAIKRGDVVFGFSKDNGDGTGEYGYKGLTDAKVPQMYGVPTQFCECEPYDGKTGKTKKYEWNVHLGCSKPRQADMQHPRNLMEDYTRYADRIYYMGFRANRKKFEGYK